MLFHIMYDNAPMIHGFKKSIAIACSCLFLLSYEYLEMVCSLQIISKGVMYVHVNKFNESLIVFSLQIGLLPLHYLFLSNGILAIWCYQPNNSYRCICTVRKTGFCISTSPCFTFGEGFLFGNPKNSRGNWWFIITRIDAPIYLNAPQITIQKESSHSWILQNNFLFYFLKVASGCE